MADNSYDPRALRQAYDALAETYDDNRGLFDMTGVIADFCARLPARPGTLADLGCGAGEPVPQAFIERGWRVIGVDFCDRMLALAGRHVPRMQRVEADMREVEFAPGSLDAVTAIYSLFHVPVADHPALFERLCTWLKPGGLALFTYATERYTGAETFSGYKEFMGQRLYYSHLAPESLRRQLSAAGLTPLNLTPRDIGGEVFLWVTVRR